jgi:hypothetical protein
MRTGKEIAAPIIHCIQCKYLYIGGPTIVSVPGAYEDLNPAVVVLARNSGENLTMSSFFKFFNINSGAIS